MTEERVQCNSCGTSYNRMFLMGKQGNVKTCPMCGSTMEGVDEKSDWITWYYYGFKNSSSSSLRDAPIDLEKFGETYYLIKEFKAPPKDENGNCDAAKKELRKYVPDAFAEQSQTPKTTCPRCFSTEIQLVPRKFSLLTGFATNQFDRICVRCQRKF